MKRFLVAVLLLAVAVLPVSAQQADPVLPSVTLPPAIDRVLRDYEAAWQARDAAALSVLFTPDAFVMAPGRPPVRGRSAVRQYYEGRGGPLSLRALAWAAADSVGYIIGAYATAGAGDVGKFTLTLRRDASGRWLIMTDMDNGNR
jgi:ketosteroid isomerase-like protein